jgi:hypothetical protein
MSEKFCRASLAVNLFDIRIASNIE